MTKRGPKPIPKPTGQAEVVRLTSRRQRAGGESERQAVRPEAPEFLGQYGREEWDRIVGDLFHLGILERVDASTLGGYCQAYDVWRTASEEFERRRAGDEVGAILQTTQSKNVIQAPLLGVINAARKEMIRIGAEFGMTPAGRTSLHGAPRIPG